MVEPKELLTPEIFAQDLNTPEKIQKVSMDLQALRAQPGWIFIERVLKIHIDNYAEKILNDEALKPEDEVACKRERAFFLLFKNLPGSWVVDLMNPDLIAKEENDDPFS